MARIKPKKYLPKWVDNQVRIDKSIEREKEFLALCDFLLSPDYLPAIEQICEKHWAAYYHQYFAFPLIKTTSETFVKRFIIQLLHKIKQRFFFQEDYRLLYHNLHIETHRFVVERYLRKQLNTY